MKSAIVKRSVVLNGRKTSVSLEDEFWEGLREIANLQKNKLAKLVRQIDRERGNRNMSSAIRVFVFNRLRAQAAGEQPFTHDRRAPAQWPTESAVVR